jgi:hypothetical protein
VFTARYGLNACSHNSGQFSYLDLLWFRQLVAGQSPRRPMFDPQSVHMRFVVDKLARTGFSPST